MRLGIVQGKGASHPRVPAARAGGRLGCKRVGLVVRTHRFHQCLRAYALSRYRRVRAHYRQPNAWKFERPSDYRSGRNSETDDEDTMWTFEPHVAENILKDMLRESGVDVLLNERLDQKVGVAKIGARIAGLKLESGNSISASIYIDLYAAVASQIDKLQKPNDVHFTDEGSEKLAEHVAKAVGLALQRKSQ